MIITRCKQLARAKWREPLTKTNKIMNEYKLKIINLCFGKAKKERKCRN